MSQCSNCGRELKPGAKFCGGCGNKVEQPAMQAAVCSNCGRELKPGAKFCGGCGNKISSGSTQSATSIQVQTAAQILPENQLASINANNGIIFWNIQQGQIAVKIDKTDFSAFDNGVRGINIQNGLKALVFLQGKIIAELESGQYLFKDFVSSTEPAKTPTSGIGRFLRGIINFFTSGVQSVINKQENPEISFVLVRAREFPLSFVFENIATKEIRIDLGLHLLCQIANVNAFYANMMLDRKMVCYETVASELTPVFSSYLTQIMATTNPDMISNNLPLQQQIIEILQSAVQKIYPFVAITQIISLSAANEDLDNIRKLNEELYISEQELIQLTKRNDFLNRMTAIQNDQEFFEQNQSYDHEIRGAELEALQMARRNKVYQDMALSQDEQDRFDLMLAAEKKIRDAKSEEDIASAMHIFKKSGMFREQELENLQNEFKHNAELREVGNIQAIAMATLQNQKALDQAKLDWEMQIGNKRLQNQIDRQRMQDAYNDERRQKDAAFDDSRRQADLNFERLEQQNQLDALRQAQAIRMERENDEHRRKMEADNAAREHDLAKDKLKFDAANEEKRIYAGMSFEQIMAANPNLTPEAAMALSKKFEAAAATAQNDQTTQMAIDSKNEIKELMQQQMAMMQQMTMQQMNHNAAIQQTMAQNNNFFQQQQLDAKQAEMERIYRDSQRNNADVLGAMSTTVRAVSDMNRPMQQQPQCKNSELQPAETKAPQQNATFCPECGSAVDGMFCEECGYKF